MKQVILSAPSPSEAAKFIGQILSIIISAILERFVLKGYYDPFPSGDLEPFLVGLLLSDTGTFLLRPT
jgi:hypothetical protein